MRQDEPERRLRVLLVEPNERIANLIRVMLEEFDQATFDLETAPEVPRRTDATMAVGLDVALLDSSIADSEAVRRLAALGGGATGLPVVLLTQTGGPELRTMAARIGAVDYLPKDALEPEVLGRTLLFTVDRHALHRELAVRAEQLDRFLETVPDVLLVSQGSRRLLSWNPRLEQVTGYSQSELGQMGLGDLLDAEADPAVAGLLGDGAREAPMRLRTRLFGTLEYVWNTMTLRDATGAEVGTVLFGRDVGEKRRADAAAIEASALALRVRELQEANEAKAALFRSFAQRMSSPLTPLSLHTHVLRMAGDATLAPSQQQSIEALHRNVERLVALRQEMLTAATPRLPGTILHRQSADVVAMVQKAVAETSASAAKVGVRIEISTPVAAPADVDVEKVGRVLRDLLASTLHRTPAGGMIRVELLARPDGLICTIQHDGPLLARDEAETLFMPAEPRSANEGRVALFVSKGLIEEHGGRMWYEPDTVGKGPRLRFSLPRPEPDDLQPDSGTGAEPQATLVGPRT